MFVCLCLGVKAYECTWEGCDYKSTHPGVLRTHMLNHTRKNWESSYIFEKKNAAPFFIILHNFMFSFFHFLCSQEREWHGVSLPLGGLWIQGGTRGRPEEALEVQAQRYARVHSLFYQVDWFSSVDFLIKSFRWRDLPLSVGRLRVHRGEGERTKIALRRTHRRAPVWCYNKLMHVLYEVSKTSWSTEKSQINRGGGGYCLSVMLQKNDIFHVEFRLDFLSTTGLNLE